MTTENRLDRDWLARLQALGKAQSHYLWVLLIATLFYVALASPEPASSQQSLHVPLIDLQLDTRIVSASGPAVLSFLILIVMGSLRAYGEAYRKLNQGPTPNFEADRFDLHPNAIDLAVYTTERSPRLILALTYFAYPLFLTTVLVEAAYLGLHLFRCDPASSPGRLGFVTVGVLLWVPAAWLVASMWIQRLARIPERWHRDAA